MKIKQFKCRASKIGTITTNHTGKSYKDQYYDALAKKTSLEERLAGFKNKECKSAVEIENVKLPETEKEISRLKPLINEIILSESAESYCKEWLISDITGKKKDIRSKYLSRGKAMEETAIKGRVSKHYGAELVKNEGQLENEYFTGEFDTETDEIIIDVKIPFDCFTFPYFETVPDKYYFGQLQVYMNLRTKSKSSLFYCLENGSEKQINDLAWQIARENGKDEPDIEEWDLAESELSYDGLPESLRKKVYEFDYDPAYIERAEKYVIACRKYIENELIPMLNL